MSEVKTDKISSVSTNGDITLDPDGTGNTIVASGNVGIGTTSPSEFVHIKGASGAATDVQIQGGDDTNSVRLFMGGSTNPLNGRIVYSTASDFMAFSTGGDQRVRVDSDGLKFSSDTAAANALDDYEEGTFTPVFNAGVTSPTYGTQLGHYTKVGRLVTFNIYIDLTAGTAASSGVVIGALPFNSINSNNTGACFAGYNNNFVGSNDPLTAIVEGNSNSIRLYRNNGGGVPGTGANVLHDIKLTGMYFTA